MAGVRSSMWSDWKAINLYGLPWFFGQPTPGNVRPLAQLDLVPDALDTIADPSVQGGAISKVQIPPSGNLSGYQAQIALPDFIFAKQREFRLADWSGARGDAMTDDGPDRVALLIENVLVSTTGTEVTTLDLMGVSVKFRGYGAPATVGSETVETQDTPIGPAFIFSSGTTAFPDMALPGDSPNGTNPPVDFAAGDGGTNGVFVARIQHLVEVPNTCAPGDVAEIIAAIRNSATGVQWYGAKYKWVRPPYPIDPNTGTQLLSVDQEGQPRVDEGPFEP